VAVVGSENMPARRSEGSTDNIDAELDVGVFERVVAAASAAAAGSELVAAVAVVVAAATDWRRACLARRRASQRCRCTGGAMSATHCTYHCLPLSMALIIVVS
jgi:hypothetical protein